MGNLLRGALAVALALLGGCTTWEDVPITGSQTDSGQDAAQADGASDTVADGVDAPDAADDVGSDTDAVADGDAGTESDTDGGGDPDADSVEPPDGIEPDGDAGQPECITPTPNLEISANAVICPGSHTVGDPEGDGAVRIVASNITVSCGGARLVGAGGGPAASGVGWRLDGVDGVVLDNCGASGFARGLYASNGSELEIKQGNFRGNFNNPDALGIEPVDVGGGIRLESMKNSVVNGAELGNNFNGIEIVGCDGIDVSGVDTSPTSNAGALLIDTRSSALTANTFSNATRGEVEPGSVDWVGSETHGSAGVWIDSASTVNSIEGNTIADCGTGIAVRETAFAGACPSRNTIRNNTVSGSAGAGVELRCDDNDVINNTIDDNQFGVWLAGADNLDVTGNTINDSAVDGISAQGGSVRHVIVRGNLITSYGRAGLLLSGKRYDAGAPLEDGAGKLFNASHLVVEANAFDASGAADIFLSWLRGAVIVSNCGLDSGLPNIASGAQAGDVFAVGECLAPSEVTSVDASLKSVTATAGVDTTLDATGTTTEGELPLTYYWLVQPNLGAWGEPSLPSVPFNGQSDASITIPITDPGQYEATVIVHNGQAADLAQRSFTVVPSGTDWAEGNASDWIAECTGLCEPIVTADTDVVIVGNSSIRVQTDADLAFWTGIEAAPGEAFQLVGGTVSFFIRVDNPNPEGWQGAFPRLELVDDEGNNRFVTPGSNLLEDAQGTWRYVSIPVGGSPPQWVVANGGVKLAQVKRIHVYTDTFGTQPYTLWLDGLTISSE